MTGDDDTHFLATFLLWIKKGKANSKLTTRRSRKMRCKSFRTLCLKNAFSNLAKVMLDMLFHLVAFSYMQYSQSYEASKAKG